MSLWANIHNRRKSGKRMRKKGEKGAPSPEAMRSAQQASEDAPAMNTGAVAGAGDDSSTVVVRKKKRKEPRIDQQIVVDRRLKDQSQPRLLKRFRQHIED